MFKICQGKGFHMTFENGWTISVQWGPMNYCDNRYNEQEDRDLFLNQVNTFKALQSKDAEIMAWDKDHNPYPFSDYDDVKGCLSADEVAKAIALISSFPADKKGKSALLNFTEE